MRRIKRASSLRIVCNRYQHYREQSSHFPQTRYDKERRVFAVTLSSKSRILENLIYLIDVLYPKPLILLS